MSDEVNPYTDSVEETLVPYGDKPGDTATLLLGAADEMGLDPYVVRNQPEDGGFRVPPDVADKAGFGEKKPAKKAAAKKTTAKKTAKKS